MNRILRETVERLLLVPKLGGALKRVWSFYGISGFATPLHEIPWLENNPDLSKLDFEGGGFDENNAKALAQLVQTILRENMMIVDVGSRKGNSTAALAKTVADQHGSVFAIDHWMGSEGIKDFEWAKFADIYSIFRRNMTILGAWNTVVHPMVMDSETASKIFANGVVDLVFIDADHRYEYIKQDILYWLPKLRHGGILCGHDCEGYYSRYPEEIRKMIDKHIGEDYIPDVCHPGVVKALHECFEERYLIMPNSVVWYHCKKD